VVDQPEPKGLRFPGAADEDRRVRPLHYDSFAVQVGGGSLHLGRWGTGGPVLLAAHGITGTHRSFRGLAEQLGEQVTLLAPDLRGRGRSNQVAGPFSMAAHAEDLVAVLDHAGVERAPVVGHSMDGFVAVVAAHRHPERVERLVLVDGGLPLDLGGLAGRPVEQVVAAVIGPALQRLRMSFPSTAAYLDYWRRHPALASDWNDYGEDAYTYDLEGEEPALRSGVREAAVLADADSQLVRDDVPAALRALRHPAVLLRAAAGCSAPPRACTPTHGWPAGVSAPPACARCWCRRSTTTRSCSPSGEPAQAHRSREEHRCRRRAQYRPVTPSTSGEEASQTQVSAPCSGARMKGHASGVSRRATGDGSARPKLLRTTPGCTQLDRHTNTVWSPSASCWAFTMSRRHGVDGLDDLDGGEGALQPPGELVCSRTVKDLVAGPALR
jgi:pimeloyl-ACP methyl ester carboxylesterase